MIYHGGLGRSGWRASRPGGRTGPLTHGVLMKPDRAPSVPMVTALPRCRLPGPLHSLTGAGGTDASLAIFRKTGGTPLFLVEGIKSIAIGGLITSRSGVTFSGSPSILPILGHALMIANRSRIADGVAWVRLICRERDRTWPEFTVKLAFAMVTRYLATQKNDDVRIRQRPELDQAGPYVRFGVGGWPGPTGPVARV